MHQALREQLRVRIGNVHAAVVCTPSDEIDSAWACHAVERGQEGRQPEDMLFFGHCTRRGNSLSRSRYPVKSTRKITRGTSASGAGSAGVFAACSPPSSRDARGTCSLRYAVGLTCRRHRGRRVDAGSARPARSPRSWASLGRPPLRWEPFAPGDRRNTAPSGRLRAREWTGSRCPMCEATRSRGISPTAEPGVSGLGKRPTSGLPLGSLHCWRLG